MTMQLKSLFIRRAERYEADYKLGTVRGEIEMEGMHSKVAVKLSDEQCRAILAIVSEAAKQTTEEAMRAMTAEVFNLPAVPALEAA
jgi:hypothetical protein